MHRQFAALRGLAMLMVVLNHSITMGMRAQQMWGFPVVSGWLYQTLMVLHDVGSMFAVPVFLFISGCFFSYAAKKAEPRSLSWKVVRASVLRVLYPYLLWSVLFYIVIFFRLNQSFSPVGYIKNLLVGYPFNFVPLILFFMVISPLLVRYSKRFGTLMLLLIFGYQLLLMGLEFPNAIGVPVPAQLGILKLPVIGGTMAVWGIYFPLGLIYSLNSKQILPWLKRFKWTLAAISAILFALTLFDRFAALPLPLIRTISVLAFILLTPTISRSAIPLVRELEKIGKHSYGLYLTNLITLEFLLLAIKLTVPQLFNISIVLFPLIFVITLEFPVWVMSQMAKSKRVHHYYRYVFG